MLMFCTYDLSAQISPGDLSSPHAHLEGMSNCTQCHDLGNKVPDQKCLACHTEIDALINQNRGFHVSQKVQDKTCVQCHNEHHGRKFQMTRFDEENFDHLDAGYALEGEHARIDCRACHIPDNIDDPEIRKRENTFLGLDDKCLSCHDDFHQNTLSNNCIECHGFESFRPAGGFDHDDANFKLSGAHETVSCEECHPNSIKNGMKFQQFTDLAFEDCKSCHDDPHSGNIPGKCTQCHTENAFEEFKGQRRFDHDKTDFELRGSHARVNCFDCHVSNIDPKAIFQDKTDIEENNCISCHDDVHEGKFGSDCAKCHSEESFLSLKSMDFFDHSNTDYPLEGQHVGVECKSCHTGRYTDDLDFSACKSCHDDYHNGEFAEQGVSPDCIDCHLLEEKFSYTTFGLEEHNTGAFPLEGAHMATPCFACHVSEDHWSFREIGQSCVDCHEDIHKDLISEKYYPNASCTACHTSESWADVTFDHSNTSWPLTGHHLLVDCRSCHFEVTLDNKILKQQFFGRNTDCNQCHENIHGDQFAENGITNCDQCHNSDSWFPDSFDHDQTAFPLDGQHAAIACTACHINEEDENGETRVIYKIKKFECIDCHL